MSDSFEISWTIACQAPLSPGFPRFGIKCWGGTQYDLFQVTSPESYHLIILPRLLSSHAIIKMRQEIVSHQRSKHTRLHLHRKLWFIASRFITALARLTESHTWGLVVQWGTHCSCFKALHGWDMHPGSPMGTATHMETPDIWAINTQCVYREIPNWALLLEEILVMVDHTVHFN